MTSTTEPQQIAHTCYNTPMALVEEKKYDERSFVASSVSSSVVAVVVVSCSDLTIVSSSYQHSINDYDVLFRLYNSAVCLSVLSQFTRDSDFYIRVKRAKLQHAHHTTLIITTLERSNKKARENYKNKCTCILKTTYRYCRLYRQQQTSQH